MTPSSEAPAARRPRPIRACGGRSSTNPRRPAPPVRAASGAIPSMYVGPVIHEHPHRGGMPAPGGDMQCRAHRRDVEVGEALRRPRVHRQSELQQEPQPVACRCRRIASARAAPGPAPHRPRRGASRRSSAPRDRDRARTPPRARRRRRSAAGSLAAPSRRARRLGRHARRRRWRSPRAPRARIRPVVEQQLDDLESVVARERVVEDARRPARLA